MSRITKEYAKQAIDVYGQLLIEHAVISDIDSEEWQKEMTYSFTVLDDKYPYPLKCTGVQQLANLLTGMWFAYDKAKSELGVGVSESLPYM